MLSGPSGVGKGSVVAAIRREHPEIWLSVSVTTRPPRPGETDGVEYHFVDAAEFDRMVRAGELLEHATYAGHAYGTPRRPLEERLAAGVPALLEIDLQGARQVRTALASCRLTEHRLTAGPSAASGSAASGSAPPGSAVSGSAASESAVSGSAVVGPEALFVFLVPPSWAELVRRLTARGTEPPDVLARRLATARRELAAEQEFDVVVVNDTIGSASARLVALMTAGAGSDRDREPAN